ncbi:MAG: hypothetical protein IJ247_00865 [Bacilli bacterium]|nr:hypothetical protein [Bacilli bacterium]
MNKKIKTLATASLLGMVGVAAASCGGAGGAKEKFEISISARKFTSEKEMLNIWEKGYEATHPNVDVIVEGWGDEGTSEAYIMNHALDRSSMTNIIYTTDDTTAYIAQLKNLVDLRPYYEAEASTDYTNYYSTMLDTTSFYGEFRPTTSYTGAYEGEKSDDPQYGVYFAPREYNMPALLCNVTLFKEHFATEEEKANWNKESMLKLFKRLGESDEWNWNTFVKALQNIASFIYQKVDVEKDTTYFSYRSAFLNCSWEPTYTSFMKELGGDGLFKLNSRDEWEVNLQSSANTAVFDGILDDFAKGKNETKYINITANGAKEFGSRKIFCAVVSYPEVGNYYETFKRLNYELDAVPFPTEYVGAGCGGYAILTDKANGRGDGIQTIKSGESAKTVDLCWDFIKYTISKEGQNLAGKEGYIQPVLKELAETGDWLDSYEGKINQTAFCTGKELRLDSFTFASPKARSTMRDSVASFFAQLFSPDKKDYTDILNRTVNELNEGLAE